MCECSRCGTSIKNVYTYEGKNYGVECVLIVSGVKKYELTSNNIDQIIKDKEARANQAEQRQQKQNEHINNLKSIHLNRNKWLIDLLIQQDYKEVYSDKHHDYIRVYRPAFYSSLAEQLETMSLADMSDKQYNAICDILESYKVAALKKFAKELNIQLPAKSKKDDVIDSILEYFEAE